VRWSRPSGRKAGWGVCNEIRRIRRYGQQIKNYIHHINKHLNWRTVREKILSAVVARPPTVLIIAVRYGQIQAQEHTLRDPPPASTTATAKSLPRPGSQRLLKRHRNRLTPSSGRTIPLPPRQWTPPYTRHTRRIRAADPARTAIAQHSTIHREPFKRSAKVLVWSVQVLIHATAQAHIPLMVPILLAAGSAATQIQCANLLAASCKLASQRLAEAIKAET
jgi:hypothetical protein